MNKVTIGQTISNLSTLAPSFTFAEDDGSTLTEYRVNINVNGIAVPTAFIVTEHILQYTYKTPTRIKEVSLMYPTANGMRIHENIRKRVDLAQALLIMVHEGTSTLGKGTLKPIKYLSIPSRLMTQQQLERENETLRLTEGTTF